MTVHSSIYSILQEVGGVTLLIWNGGPQQPAQERDIHYNNLVPVLGRGDDYRAPGNKANLFYVRQNSATIACEKTGAFLRMY